MLVLAHGALGDSRDWRRQLEGLSDELTVVAWDAGGCGASDDPPEPFRPAGMRAMIRSFADADLRDVLPGIRVPTLLLYGDADRRSPLGTVAAELHRMIPGSRLRILAGVGHAANLEAPERFNAEVREFLGSVP